jgi:hypothetical protein
MHSTQHPLRAALRNTSDNPASTALEHYTNSTINKYATRNKRTLNTPGAELWLHISMCSVKTSQQQQPQP